MKIILTFIPVLVITAILSQPQLACAQMPGWSQPVNVSDSPTESTDPSITADPAGGVHLVWVERYPEQNVILYTDSKDQTWEAPIDIVASPSAGRLGGLAIQSDSRGYLHLVFGGIGIQYTRAYAPLAGSAKNWQPPIRISTDTDNITPPDLDISSDGHLHVVYAKSIGRGSGVYYLSSTDYGETWSDTKLVYDNSSSERMVSEPKIALGGDGTIHVVWVEHNYPESFPPIGIRYANSKDRVNWNAPINLGDGPYHYPEVAAKGDQEVHVVWSGANPDRFKFHRWSRNSGIDWLYMWRDKDLGGFQYSPALALDSLGRLYWFNIGSLFNRTIPPGINDDQLFMRVFTNGIWSNGIVLADSSVTKQNMQKVSSTVSLGNEIHLALMAPFYTSDEEFQMDVIHLHSLVDAPRLEALPLAAPTSTAEIRATEVPQPTPLQ